nr:universal stress protein Slr1101 [Hydra vulgaris]
MEGRINAIAIDDSITSERAFSWYLNHYHKTDDKLLLIHIHQMPQLPPMGLSGALVAQSLTRSFHEMVEDSIKESKHAIAKFESQCRERNIKHEVIFEDDFHSPGNMICEMAQKHKAEAIIMGQRGLGTMKRLLLGSTSDYVLHHANVPVVIVPPPSEN